MSRTIRYFAIAVIATFIASQAFAAGTPTPTPSKNTKWAVAEKNYIKALTSENDGVRISAAGFLGRYQLLGSIDALIQMLQTDKSEQARSAAAFALILMNDPRGVDAVKDASLYDGSDKVAAFCTRLLNLPNDQYYSTLAGE
jgi:hypothetical protein